MRLVSLAAALALSACAAAPPRHPEQRPPIVIAERFLTPSAAGADVDSVAVWPGEAASLIATAKTGDRLLVFDAVTGAPRAPIGAPGTGVGELDRPNGILVLDDYAFVVERDNHRLQVFRLPAGESVATFGADALRRPYGITGYRERDAYVLYVTDNYEDARGGFPPDAELSRRVHRFQIADAGGVLRQAQHTAFGSVTMPGRLRKVETIMADPAHRRLLIAEEDERVVKIYDLDGAYTGRSLSGWFRFEPEGIALVPCGTAGGYWVMTDQSPRADRNIFHVFSRDTLDYAGSFRGRITHTTDGVVAAGGRFYALHADAQVSAFDWTDIARELALDSCGARP